MSRKGKDLEKLIEQLEKFYLPHGLINSPDYIIDNITGEKREVDISIRINAGTVELLVVIECRDRNNSQDVTWIEQLHAKTQSLNANKVIAVATNGFSKQAIDKAHHYGIETRTLTEITEEKIKDWFKVDFIEKGINYFTITKSIINLLCEVIPDDLPKPSASDEVFFIEEKESGQIKKVSLNTIFDTTLSEANYWEKIPNDGKYHKEIISIQCSDDSLFITHKGEKYIVNELKIEAEIKNEITLVPISKITSYSSQNDTIAETVEFKNVLPDSNQIFQVTKIKDGSIYLSTRKNYDENKLDIS